LTFNAEQITKLIEIIQHDIIGLSFESGIEDEKKQIKVKYNNENKLYFIEIYAKNGKEVKSSSKIEDIIIFLGNDEYGPKVTQFLDIRKKRENIYQEAKANLLNQLNTINISDIDKEKMRIIIEQVSQLSDRVGMGNRFYINNYEHLRLADESRFDDIGNNLHLQLVRRQESPNGMMMTDYPDLTFEQLIMYLCGNNLLNTEEFSSKKRS